MNGISIFVEIVASASAILIVLYLLCARYQKKKTYHNVKTTLWVIGLVVIAFCQPFGNLIASILVMTLFMIFSILFFEGKVVDKILFIVVINVVTIFISAFCLNGMAWLTGQSVRKLTQYGGTVRNIEVIVMQFLCVGVAYCAGIFLKKKQSLSWREEMIVGITFVVYFFMGITFMLLIQKNAIPTNMQSYLQIVYLLILATFFVILWLVTRISNAHQLELETKLLSQRVASQEQMLYCSDASYQKMRMLRHDMMRYLNVYKKLLKDGQYEQLESEMSKLVEKTLAVDCAIYTKNLMINSLLNEKVSICRKEGIEIFINIIFPQMKISVEILVLLANILDNAIEAERKQLEGKREIKLDIKWKQELLSILVRNYIEGSVLEKNPELETTKNDKLNHGLGIQSIKSLVEKNNGKIEIYEENHEFCVHAVLELKDMM